MVSQEINARPMSITNTTPRFTLPPSRLGVLCRTSQIPVSDLVRHTVPQSVSAQPCLKRRPAHALAFSFTFLSTDQLANPVSAPTCGLPVALSVNVIVPDRVTPLGAVTFVKRTPTVQLAPAASVVPVQLSDPPTTLKYQVISPPPVPFATATALIVVVAPDATVLVFVNVTVPVPESLLRATVIASGFGLTDAVAGATPVPLSVTGEPVTVALPPVMVAVPDAGPAVVGANTMLIVQVEPAARVAVQVLPVPCANGAVTATAAPVKSAPPVLCSVRVSAALVDPSATLPKASGPPVTLTMAMAGATYSTAPASTDLLVLRALP